MCVSVCVCVCLLSEFPFSFLISLEICYQHTLLVLITHLEQGALDKGSFFDQSEACHEPALRKEKPLKASVVSQQCFNSCAKMLAMGSFIVLVTVPGGLCLGEWVRKERPQEPAQFPLRQEGHFYVTTPDL